jgi:tetratricopeptide (TPR) repeat protein
MSVNQSLEYAQAALTNQSWDLCRQWLEHALREATSEGPARQALVLNNLGVFYRRLHEPRRAEECFEKAWSLAQSRCGAQAQTLQGRILANWAVLDHRQGRLIEARRRYQDSLLMCSEPVEDELAVARICLNLSWLHLQQDRLAQATTLLNRARGVAQKYPRELQLWAYLHLGSGRLALAEKRLAKAEMETLLAVRQSQKLAHFDPLLQAQTRAALANVYSLQARTQLDLAETNREGLSKSEEADRLFCQALDMLDDWGVPISFEYLESLSLRVDHLIRVQKFSLAEQQLQRLLVMLTEMDNLDPAFQMRAWERAAEVLARLGQTEMAAAARLQCEALSGKKSRS